MMLYPQGYLDWIHRLPAITPPAVFGLHANADIAKDLSEAQLLLDSLLTLQSSSSSSAGGGGKAGAARTSVAAPAGTAVSAAPAAPAPAQSAARSAEDVIAAIAADILGRLPPNFDVEAAEAAFPSSYHNSMNTVLVQVRGHAACTYAHAHICRVLDAAAAAAACHFIIHATDAAVLLHLPLMPLPLLLMRRSWAASTGC